MKHTKKRWVKTHFEKQHIFRFFFAERDFPIFPMNSSIDPWLGDWSTRLGRSRRAKAQFLDGVMARSPKNALGARPYDLGNPPWNFRELRIIEKNWLADFLKLIMGPKLGHNFLGFNRTSHVCQLIHSSSSRSFCAVWGSSWRIHHHNMKNLMGWSIFGHQHL